MLGQGQHVRTVSRLRFRRWTRSRAAVFHSLSHNVTIGHLATSVTERLAGKCIGLLAHRSGDTREGLNVPSTQGEPYEEDGLQAELREHLLLLCSTAYIAPVAPAHHLPLRGEHKQRSLTKPRCLPMAS